MGQLTAVSRSKFFGIACGLACLGAILCLGAGCDRKPRPSARRAQQAINAARTKSDSLHDATRYLAQMTPLNRAKVGHEVQLHLNKWLQTAGTASSNPIPKELLEGLPPGLRSAAGAENASGAQFDTWDVEYLHQCRLYRQLSSWIIERPLRDSLLRPWLEEQAKTMPNEELAEIEQACKLFDWSVRNIVLQGDPGDVERLLDDPREPLNDAGIGYRYLPWQTILYSRGDFVERGRVFTALAQQRGLQTVWIALRVPSSPSAKVWTVGVLVGEKCYLFEPKLGLPIVHPDTFALATLEDVQKDDRILRRLDVPGRFDYAVNPGDAAKVEFLIEVEPSAVADRMTLLQASLTGDERLRLQSDVRGLTEKLAKLEPDAPIALWQTPLLARLYAIGLRSRLEMNSPFTVQYMIEHAAWLVNTPAAVARQKHLAGEFENTFDAIGALRSYMDCRLPDELIDRLPDDPDVQKELGIPRENAETLEEYQRRLQQFQVIFRQAKVDADFLLGQVQFDLGQYGTSEDWLKNHTLVNPAAARWHYGARYTLARDYQEEGKTDEAVEQLNENGSPMEAGNRLRARYLTR